jgi:hypothetical protein
VAASDLRWRGAAQTKRGIIQGAEWWEKWLKDPKSGKTRAVVVRSKKEYGIAWGSGAHLQLAGRFPGSNRQTCAVSVE